VNVVVTKFTAIGKEYGGWEEWLLGNMAEGMLPSLRHFERSTDSQEDSPQPIAPGLVQNPAQYRTVRRVLSV
jgi:hypothetical protein